MVFWTIFIIKWDRFTIASSLSELRLMGINYGRGGSGRPPNLDSDLLKSRGGLPDPDPDFPDFLLKIRKSRDVTRLSSTFPDFSRLFPVFLT